MTCPDLHHLLKLNIWSTTCLSHINLVLYAIISCARMCMHTYSSTRMLGPSYNRMLGYTLYKHIYIKSSKANCAWYFEVNSRKRPYLSICI